MIKTLKNLEYSKEARGGFPEFPPSASLDYSRSGDFYWNSTYSMSLKDARMPRLSDKLEAQAEKVRDGLEKSDMKDEKIIGKKSKKN